MLARTMPGFVVAMVLGAAFCLHGEYWSQKEMEAVRERESGKWEVSRALIETAPSRVFREKAMPETTAAPVSGDAIVWSGDDAEVSTDSLSALPVSVAEFENIGETERRSEVAAATARRNGGSADLSSAEAFASMNAFCDSETSAWIPTGEYPEQPLRGLEVWSSVEKYSGKQDWRREHNYDSNIYSHDGNVYSLGLRQDWSVDSVIGASIDILDAEVRGRFDGDQRKNDITGYIGNAHYFGTFVGKYPVELKGAYGRLYHKGEGDFESPGNGIGGTWRESRHRSHYYGFHAKAGIPLLFGGVVKVLPEFGFDYQKVRTNQYEVTVTGNATDPITMAAMKSRSVMLPLSVTFKRDYKQCWGLVTPRVKLGWARELDDTAAGVRALNSSSASAQTLYSDASGAVGINPVTFDPAQKDNWEFEAGLDIRTIGGWNVSGNYRREWATKYTKDQFSLELGRCF